MSAVRNNQEGGCGPGVRIHRGRGWRRVLLPQVGTGSRAELRQPAGGRAGRVRDRSQPERPARAPGQASRVLSSFATAEGREAFLRERIGEVYSDLTGG